MGDRKLVDGTWAQELDQPVNLVIKTKCPSKWKIVDMETGKAYRLEISSMGFKEYELEAEEFFRNIWIRSIEIDGVELDAPIINEIEFEREGEVEIKFVPIRPGEYDFEIERLQSKGMVGKFIVK